MTCGLQQCSAHNAFTTPLSARSMNAQSLHLGRVKTSVAAKLFLCIFGLLDMLNKAECRSERWGHAVDFLSGLLITVPLHRCGKCTPVCIRVVAV